MEKIKAENRGIDKKLFQILCDSIDKTPCHRTMGIDVLYLDNGGAGFVMHPSPDYSTPGGRVHGGILTLLADTAMSVAISTGSAQFWRTLEISLNYLRPVYEEQELRAEANVVHSGNTISVAEVGLYNGNMLLAKGKGTFIRDTKFKHPALDTQ